MSDGSMKNNMNDLEQFCSDWLASWTGNHPEKLRGFYTENAVYRDPAKPNGLMGPELLPYFKRLLQLNPNWTWHVQEILPTASGFCLKWRAEIPVGEKMIHETGLDIVEIENRKICRNEVFFDRVTLLDAMQAKSGITL